MPRCVAVLGATSKLWQATQRFWGSQFGAAFETFTWARRAGPGVDFVSSTHDIAEILPRCDVVVALWGITSGSPGDLSQNKFLAERAHDIARNLGAKAVVHAMSGAVYAPSDSPLTEFSQTEPRHAYGRAKLLAERVALAETPRGICLRLGNIAGADGLAAAIRLGAPMVLDRFEDGSSPRRSYLAPDDFAQVLQHIVHAPNDAPQILNVAGPEPVTMNDLLRARHVPFTYCNAPTTALPIQHLDTQRLASFGICLDKSSDVAHLSQFLPKWSDA